jgi:hypothetical protein
MIISDSRFVIQLLYYTFCVKLHIGLRLQSSGICHCLVGRVSEESDAFIFSEKSD